MGELGAFAVPAALTSVGAGLFFIPRLAAYFSLAPKLGSLLAAGTSICGVTAIGALSPAIAATQAETAVAVANVVAFGTAGMLTLPYVARYFFADCPEAAGLFLGLAVHDTAQVMGAGMAYEQRYGDEKAYKVAAVTKLTRNLLLAAAIPALAAAHGKAGYGVKTAAAIPPFLLAFLSVSVLRSAGDAYFASAAAGYDDEEKEEEEEEEEEKLKLKLKRRETLERRWRTTVKYVGGELAPTFVGTALAGVGLSTSASVVRGVGATPFLVGAGGAAVVGGVGLASALTLASVLPRYRARQSEKESAAAAAKANDVA